MKNQVIKSIGLSILGVALVLLGGLQQANAATLPTQTYTLENLNFLTLSGLPVSIAKFDSSIGILQKVTITLSGAITDSAVKITTGDTDIVDSGTVQTRVRLTLGSSVISLVLLTNSANVNPIDINDSEVVSTGAASGSNSTEITTSLADWTAVGDSSTDLNLVASYLPLATLSQGGSPVTSVDSADGNATVSVTYTYNDFEPLPEPATWAMILGGVGILALTQRVRRRSI